VRTLEARARRANEETAPRSGRTRSARTAIHPDQEAAAAEIADVLERALGTEVKVRPTTAGGYLAELGFDTQEQALALAGRLRRGA
jgi:hypothetical protein